MEFKTMIGNTSPSDSPRVKRARVHQGWWRTFVLNKDQGLHPIQKENSSAESLPAYICNTLPHEMAGYSNFVSEDIALLALHTAAEHAERKDAPGMMEIKRLKTNLLSSQPLCFNFFGLLALDLGLGLKVLQSFYPDITALESVLFEYAPTPSKDYTNDNSAFDVAFKVIAGDKAGLIGIECKYTEPFSPKPFKKDRYLEVYDKSSDFRASYEELTSSKFNQLFRNQLIAESLIQNGNYDFVRTALFCAPDDMRAKETGAEFGSKIKSGFKVLDFFEFITVLQKLEITPAQRNTTMMLWARYMAHELSDAAYSQF